MASNIYRDMTDLDILRFVLKNDVRFQNPYKDRPLCVTLALWKAYRVLPQGSTGARALYYVASHPKAIFCFGGKDVVGPAIQEAIDILEKKGRAVA